MKLIAILLLFVAATQAISIPNYQYWCTHHFHVFPPTNSYGHNVNHDPAWFTAKFYAHILKSFPKRQGLSCESNPDNITDYVLVNYTNKMTEKRNDMKEEMEGNLGVLEAQIEDIHESYLKTFKEYLKRVYKEDSELYCNKTQEYVTELANLKSAAITRYNNSIIDMVDKLEHFHKQLVTKFLNCMLVREIKVDEYERLADLKNTTIQAKYEDALTDHMTKRRHFAESVFQTLYGSLTLPGNLTSALANFTTLLDIEKANLTTEFHNKITDAVAKAKDCYRCNYKCYFNTGCYGFEKQQYKRTCKPIPDAPKYVYKLIRVQPFNPKWSGYAFDGLKEFNASATEEFLVDDYKNCIDYKAGNYTEQLAPLVTNWRNLITIWGTGAFNTLKARISTMKPKSTWGTCPTEDEITAYRSRLETEAQSWVDAKKEEFDNHVTDLNYTFHHAIAQWQNRSKDYADSVYRHFVACQSDREAKIAHYETHLANKICSEKSKIKLKVEALSRKHLCLFDQFFDCTFGKNTTDYVFITDLKQEYHEEIARRVSQVTTDFQDFWDTWQPKLVSHYKATFKCVPKFSVPLLGAKFEWNFCPPSTNLWQPSC